MRSAFLEDITCMLGNSTLYLVYKNIEIILELKQHRLVGDNIYYEIHARVQSQQHRNCSMHWTHQFAVPDRVQDPQLDSFSSQKPVSEIQFADNDVMANLVRNWSVIVSRVITNYLLPFHQFSDVVVRHIPHEYSREMSQKSDSVSSSLTTLYLM